MISRSKCFFLFIVASVADAAAVRLNIPNGLITDFTKRNPDFNNGAKNLPFCILVNCAFENLILLVVSKGFTNICNLPVS